MAVIHTTGDSFKKEVLESKGVVLVDFYADWCGPCQMTSPIIEELAKDKKFEGKVKFIKVNVDTDNELAGKYNVFSIPTFIIFRDGKPVDQFTGVRDKAGFEAEINKHSQ